ncbi:MAG: GNAT family N-acetyltransferase [Ktedonobacterales bacterium]|nr:GNAT family N-acetyltransferase [Ktedonobacterales bacterium]
MLWQDGELALREITEDDVDLMARWLTDPAVLGYYEGRDRPHNADLVREVFFNAHVGDETRCIILAAQAPIGYLQFYRVTGDEVGEYGYPLDAALYGLDLFIGEPDYWNRGIGTRLLTGILPYLHEHQGAERVIVDPQMWNSRAIRSYEKAGFRKVRALPQHELHEGELRDAWLMEWHV